MNDKERYEDYRKKWVHEDDLIHQRIGWLLSSQAFLFTAYGALLTFRTSEHADDIKSAVLKISDWRFEIKALSAAGFIFSGVGLYLCVFAFIGIRAAEAAMKSLKADYASLLMNNSTLPRLDVTDKFSRAGVYAAINMPVMFGACWSGILFYEILLRI